MQICNECKKTFSHSAKLTQTIPLTNDKMKARFAEHEELPICDSVEISVCPYCFSPDIAEAPQVEQPKQTMEDMVFVEFANVKAYIKDGYVELDRKDHVFSKGLIMIKEKEGKN